MTKGRAVKRRGGRLIKVAMPAAALLATATGLILSLLAPHFLPSSAYVEFSLLFGYGQLTATILFEWSRQAGLRYAYGRDSELAGQRRGTLVAFYALAITGLAAGGVLILCLPGMAPPYRLGAIVALYAAAQGSFDVRQAFARAAGDDVRFSISLLSRAILSLGMFVAVAVVTRDGVMATLALAGSYVAATLATSVRQPWSNPFGRLAPDHLRFLLVFGLTGAAASIVAIMAPNIVRSAAVVGTGAASVGGFLLALDLSQKGLSAIGMVASLVLTQRLYRAYEHQSEAEFLTQGRVHIAATLGLLAPAFVGFVLVQDQMAVVLVPESYRPAYLAWVASLSMGAVLTCVRIFAIDPFFYAHGRASLVLVGAVANIVVLGGAALLVTINPAVDFAAVVVAYVGGAGFALAVSTVLLLRTVRPSWPLRELGTIALGCLAMAGASLVPVELSLLGLVLKTVLCAGAYAAVIFMFNVGSALASLSLPRCRDARDVK